MIIPVNCFSCGTPCSHNYFIYLDKVKYYTENPDKCIVYEDLRGKTTPEFMALSDLKIGNDCCRRMYLLQYSDLAEKIN